MQLCVAHISTNEHGEPEIGDVRSVDSYEQAHAVAVHMVKENNPATIVRLFTEGYIETDEELREYFEENLMVCFRDGNTTHTVQIIGIT